MGIHIEPHAAPPPRPAPPGSGPTRPATSPGIRFATQEDIDEFIDGLERYERGEWTADTFLGFRLLRGVYGQRQAGEHMLRVKIPQGIVAGPQLRRLAEVAERFSRGSGHLTTRQNLQLHFVSLDTTGEALQMLEEVGLTTREACGNTVRNVCACFHAGVSRREPFDVTPYAESMTRYLLRQDLIQKLPRKFKIAFSCSPDDCVRAAIHDLGFLPVVRVGRRGFRVLVGGGLSVQPQDARLYTDFLPVERLLPFARAVITVFNRDGQRQDRARARMKYLIKAIGLAAFVERVERELAELADVDPHVERYARRDPFEPLAGAPSLERLRAHAVEVNGNLHPDFLAWLDTNVEAQRQAGYAVAQVTIRLGDLTAAQLGGLADLAERFGEGEVRITLEQNVALRWVRVADLPELHAALAALGLGRPGAAGIADPLSCPGAATCKLAVTSSRGLASVLADLLGAANGGGELAEAARDLQIKISGCPNSCGHHHVAGLGFHGGVRKVAGKLVPVYQLHLGGGVDASGATFGRQVVKIPARRVAAAVLRLLRLYVGDRATGESAIAFFRRVESDRVRELLRDLTELEPQDVGEEDRIDLGADVPFTLTVGVGECAS